MESTELARRRDAMVRRTIAGRDVQSEAVLAAMQEVPRHRFLPVELEDLAYRDQPVPIGMEQTISQPYIVAKMAELAQVGPGSRVLDVGTGSGYQAAVLAALGADVWSIEILPALSARAREVLDVTGYGQVRTRVGDGSKGLPEAAPYDAIVVAAAPHDVPPALLEQLAPGGRLVIPVGGRMAQELWVYRRTERGIEQEAVCPVLFVPMTSG